MSDKLLSVIVPVFNAEKYLEQCINSILGQSYRSIELILVDDGSTDDSERICRQYLEMDSRVRYYRVPNGGPLKARAFGVELCRGEWFTFCDSDDYYQSKNSLKKAVISAESYSCDVLQFGVVRTYRHLKQKKSSVNSLAISERDEFNQRDYPSLLCNQWPSSRLTTNACNKLYSRRLIKCCPQYDTLPRCFWGEDLILNLFLLSDCSRIVYSPECLYTYRYGGGTSAWKQSAMEDLNIIKSYQNKYLSDWRGDQKERIRNYMYSEMASWFYLHIQSGLGVVSEVVMREHIIRTLDLPMFQKAHRYYLEENSEKWEAVKLLRDSDPDAYLLSAKNALQNRPLKSTLKRKLINVLKRL